MKESSENNKNNLLQKWLSGDMTRQQERQLEEKAATDPFLADAMEGFGEFPEQDFEEKIAVFQQTLQKRTQQKKERRIIPFYWSRVAAMLAFAVVAGGAFWFLNQNIEQQPENSMAMEQKQKKTIRNNGTFPIQQDMEELAEIKATDEAEPEINEKIASNNNSIKNQQSNKNKSSYKKLEKKPSAKPNPYSLKKDKTAITKRSIPTPPSPITEVSAKQTESQNSATFENDDQLVIENNREKISEERSAKPGIVYKEKAKEKIELTRPTISSPITSATSAPPSPRNMPASKATTNQLIGGLVLNKKDEPLIGASISEKGTNNGTVTDFDGRFQLELNDVPNTLDIAYTGYTKEEIRVNNNKEDLLIRLEEGTLLESVEIVALGKSKLDSSNIIQPRPSIGFNKFKKYIKNNRQLTNEIKGNVVVQFKIDRNGLLSDFKILESLGDNFDEEAIRLLKEGGQWELPIGQDSAIETYTFKFKK